MPNRLSDEASLYLRQHADNPVDWYPWGDEAFTRAVAEDRPVLLSVGYSSCHWCHVMAHESFEDPATAEVMNRHFVCVKVDREERPDIDALYMQATVAMAGHGGWPMTVILTPQGEPFFAGTYFPPTAMHGRPSFTDVLEHVSEAYRTRRSDVIESAQRVVRALTQAAGLADHTVDRGVLDDAVTGLAMSFDPDAGGFGAAPKFPPTVVLDFLLPRLRGRPDDVHVRRMVEQTLDAMAAGGIHDHVAGGFHRYSVDRVWLVPHFEKMLYDNALLAGVYSRAYMVSGDPHYRQVAERTFAYLIDEMRLSDGGFATSQDADSPGGEGAFFVWTHEELRRLLTPDEARAVEVRFGVTAEGNFEGANILHVVASLETVGQAVGQDAPLLISSALGKLAQARTARIAPARDDALIGAWNSLAAQAFAIGAVALGRPDLVTVAEETVDTVRDRLYVKGRLHRSWAGGRANHLGVLEDYANLAQALIALHDATLRWSFVEQAIEVCEQALALFGEPDSDGVRATGHDAPTLVAPVRDLEDHPAPGGNSQLALALARLGDLAGRTDFLTRAERLVASVAESSRRAPQAFGTALAAIDWLTAPERRQIAIVVGDADPAPFVDAARAAGPYTSVVLGHADSGAPLLEGRSPLNGRTTAYVCTDMRCLAPIDDAGALADVLVAD